MNVQSMLFRSLAAVALGTLLTGAGPLRVADPMTFMSFLVGNWNCTSASGGKTQTYTAQYQYVLGGGWLRTTNTAKNFSSEDMMTYANHKWIVIDMEPTRDASVLEAPDQGAAHIPFATVYPKPGLNVTFDRISTTKYTLTFSGTLNGKPTSSLDTCVKV